MPVDLAYRAYGEGPAVVLLHGLLGAGRNWTQIAKRLAGQYRVLAADLRNHGDSPWAETMGYEEMALDVRRLLEREGHERAAIVGHSMGGKVAMALALLEPGSVERPVVVDVAPVPYRRSFLSYIEAMQAVDLATIERRSDADRALASTVPEPGVRGFLLQNLELEQGARWKPNLEVLARVMPGLIGFSEQALGRRYDGPTLFIAGARSDYVRPEHRPAIDRLFPAARLVTIKDAGHWVHAEQPARFTAVLEAFLAAPQGARA